MQIYVKYTYNTYICTNPFSNSKFPKPKYWFHIPFIHFWSPKLGGSYQTGARTPKPVRLAITGMNAEELSPGERVGPWICWEIYLFFWYSTPTS